MSARASQQVAPTARSEAGTSPHRPDPWRKLRENAEAVLVAIILALIIRHFSVEAFEIPTGSMAPALLGIHVETTCPNCETRDLVGLSTDNFTGAINTPVRELYSYVGNCPSCGCSIEDRVGSPGPTVWCPGCNAQRPANPSGFEGPLPLGAIDNAWCSQCQFQYREVFTIHHSTTPILGPLRNRFAGGDWRGGHKLLVNKFVYQLREPRRWEVIVFKFNRQRNYIKRLVGLPGEEIQVVQGDIHINGRVERKPVWAQDELWVRVHDSAQVERGFAPQPAWSIEKGWAPIESDTQEAAAGAWSFNALGARAHLAYQRPIQSRLAYNAGGHGGYAIVHDVRVVADVSLNGGAGWLDVQLINGPQVFTCRLAGLSSSGPGTIELRARPGPGEDDSEQVLHRMDHPALRLQAPVQVDFWVADGWLVLRLDGEVLAELELPEPYRTLARGDRSSVALVAHDTGGRLERVQVFRDVYYTDSLQNTLTSYACKSPFRIPADHLFAMGDNSSSSMDSRAWGALDRQNLLGRAFVIFWPALPWRWQVGFIR